MFTFGKTAESVSGVAQVDGIKMSGDRFQVNVNKVTTGTGTATITVKAGNDSEFTSIVDGTIDMSAPVALVVEGTVNAVLCTSNAAGDTYVLEVSS